MSEMPLVSSSTSATLDSNAVYRPSKLSADRLAPASNFAAGSMYWNVLVVLPLLFEITSGA